MKRCVMWVLTFLLLAVLCGESFADTRCSHCGGTGQNKCGTCNGTGKCSLCSGRGEIYAPGGYKKCTVCRGSKKCNVCGGDGKKGTCSHCGGKGYISSSPSSGGNSNPSSGGNSGGGSSGGSEGTDYDSIITTINETNFPDDVFREYVKSNFDNDSDGYLRTSEIASAHTIDVNSKGISSLRGIEYFTSLWYLNCSNNQLTELDVSKCTRLDSLSCSDNQLTTLELSYFASLSALRTLNCSNNQLTKLEVFRCTKLTELDVSNNPALTELDCSGLKLTKLDVSNNTALTKLSCSNNQLTTLDVRGCTNLDSLSCSFNQLTELDVSTNTALTELWCYNNQLTELDVSKNTALTKLSCKSNQLTMLDVSTNTALNSFSHDGGVLIITDTAEINEKNFPDATFREYVRSNFDKNSNDYLDATEIANTTSIHVNNKGISSLKGIEYFIVLTSLKCSNNKLAALDVSKNTALTELYCENNQLAEINISNSTALTELYCENNQLTELDVSKNTALTKLWCGSNKLTTLDVSKNTALTTLACYNNKITELDVSKNTALTWLSCEKNQLAKLDVSKCTALTWLDCKSNQLTKLDVSGCTQLESLYCSNNKLTELDVRKNTALTTLYCENNQLTNSNTILIISPETLPSGETGTDYYATLSANLSKVTWSASGLPSWLKFSASTGELYGKPTTGGTYTFTVTASLSSLKASKTYTLNISAGQNTPQPEFRTHSLVLSGQIGVNFFMYLPEISGIDYTKSYVEFDINGDKSNPPQYFDQTFKNSKGTYYGFRCYIKSIQMADKITATFHYGNNQTVTHEYSAKKYLDDSLAANISSEERALIEAIKDYGHYAQLYLSSIHTWELGRDYAAIDCENDYSASEIEAVRKAVAGNAIVRDTGTASGVQRVGFSLSLDSDTTINLYIYPASGYTGAVSATLSGSNENLAVYQASRNRYEVKLSNISAHKLSDTYTVGVKAQKDFDVKVSAFSYVCDALNDFTASEAERKAVVSLYKYYVTAMDYRAATGH